MSCGWLYWWTGTSTRTRKLTVVLLRGKDGDIDSIATSVWILVAICMPVGIDSWLQYPHICPANQHWCLPTNTLNRKDACALLLSRRANGHIFASCLACGLRLVSNRQLIHTAEVSIRRKLILAGQMERQRICLLWSLAVSQEVSWSRIYYTGEFAIFLIWSLRLVDSETHFFHTSRCISHSHWPSSSTNVRNQTSWSWLTLTYITSKKLRHKAPHDHYPHCEIDL